MNNPYVGVLLNHRLYERIRRGNTGHEALMQYVWAGKRFGVTPCFLQLNNMVPGRARVKAYVLAGSSFTLEEVDMPAVIHNRAIYKDCQSDAKLEEIAQRGAIVFNRRNRYGKQYIHRLLMENVDIRKHLPETVSATLKNIREMMKHHHSLILKPNNGSIGKGIMLLEYEKGSGWRLKYRRRGMKKWYDVWLQGNGQLPMLLRRRITRTRYLVQQRLPLAKYEGRPFDIRVSVQRDSTGYWQVTGMVGKAAGKKSFLTNVAQGGKVYPLEQMITAYRQLDHSDIQNSVALFSLKVAEHLGSRLPQLADIGLDIGITEYGFPMFIECNGRDQRYSFRSGGLLEEWTSTYSNPMGYAAYLLKQPTLVPVDLPTVLCQDSEYI